MLTGCQAVNADTPGTTAGTTAGGSSQAGDPSCGGSAKDLDGALKVITGPIGCPGAVNTFWSQKLGGTWTAPRFIAYRDGDIPGDQCGQQDHNADDFAGNAFYCRLDDTVAYSQDFLAQLYKQGGPTYPMFVLMHELGHRVTALTHQTGAVSRSEENQADCLAGAESKFTYDARRLPAGDVVNGAVLFFSLGDSGGHWFRNEPSVAADAHGTPTQRGEAFGIGYFRGTDKCFDIGRSRDGSFSPISGLFG
jgi:predicted metalloprotease